MSNSRKIFFFAPFGTFAVHHQLDAIFSLAMKLRGYDAFAVLCDGIYPVCDVLAWSGEKSRMDCANCARSSKSFLELFGLRTLQMRGYFSDEELLEIRRWAEALRPEEYYDARWNDAPIGQWIISSVCSFFRITSKQLHEPKVRAAHKMFLINGALTYLSLNRIIDQERPSHAMVFNGRFAPYRVALESCRRLSIPVITHERGWAQDTFVAYSNAMSIETEPIYECAEAWKDVPLEQPEIDRVRSYFINREKGVDINVTPFLSFQTEHSRIRAQLRIPPEKRIVALYTTGEYELEFCDAFKAEISQLDLIRLMIDIFRDRPEALVIRHHPYIAGDETSPPDKHFLGQAAALALSAPDNVRVVMPGERLSSYALMWNSDATIAPFSMTGVESVARGIPAYGFYQSPFRPGLCGIFRDFSRAGLEATLTEILDSQSAPGVEDLRRLYRFQSSFISRLCSVYRSFGFKDIYGCDIKLKDISELQPGVDPALDRLCDHVEKGSPLFELPAPQRVAAGPSEETALLQEELRRIKDKRYEVRVQASNYFLEFQRPQVLLIRERSENSRAEAWQSCLSRSRHQLLDYQEASFDNIEKLISLVATSSAPLCALAPSEVLWIDEAFLSRGCEELLYESSINAAIAGQWYLTHSGQIQHGLFTRHYHSQDPSVIRRSIGALGNWLSVLTSGVFRKETLIELLSCVKNESSSEARIALALVFARRPDVKLMKEGLVYCRGEQGG
jgi:hypothetical protein